MRVLLIPLHTEHFRNLPLGIAYISAVLLREKHDVRVYDPPPYEKPDLMGIVRDYRPDLIGLSCMTPSFWKSCEVAREIKSVFGIPIVIGGIHSTAEPEGTMRNGCFDFLIYGEGEITMAELVEALEKKRSFRSVDGLMFREGENVVKNRPRELIGNLDSLPYPARHLFPRWYFMRHMTIRGLWLKCTNMVATRGCPYGCTYCSSKIMFGRKVRYRSVKSIVDEIEHLIGRYKIEAISFSDDTFTVNKEFVKRFCDEIGGRKIKVKMRVQARADCIDDDMIKMLKGAGCVQFDVGVESGSEKILKVLDKGITPEQVRKAFRLYHENNMRTCATFMIGSPGETMDDVRKTVQLAKDIEADYTQFFITTPFPGTLLHNELKKTGNIIDMPYENMYVGGRDLHSAIKNTIPADELLILQRRLNEQFLKGSVSSLLLNWRFLLDTLSLMLQRPRMVLEAFGNFYKTGRITEIYRTFYYSHNFRRL